jgi:tetratricopeptide (TPR) repeat protein
VARPLSALRIVADGQSVYVRDDRGSFEPTTGQARLDFDVSTLRDDVVRVLQRSRSPGEHQQAYDHYLRGAKLDTNEQTQTEAEAAYRKAIALDPSLSNAYTNLGSLMFRRGKIDEAEKLYRQALRIDCEQPEAYYNLGFLLYERGEAARAIDSFKAALRNDPSFADAHFNLAMALEDRGQDDEAREHWQTYLKLDPQSPWAEIARRHLRSPG